MRKQLCGKLIFCIMFLFCFAIIGCKKIQPETSVTGKLAEQEPTFTINATDASQELVDITVLEEVNEEPEVMDIELDSSTFSPPTPKQIQAALKSAGYYKGEIDGEIGPRSQNAILDFQKNNDLKPDGKVGPKTWSKLKKYLD